MKISINANKVVFAGTTLRTGDKVNIFDTAGKLISKGNLDQNMTFDISNVEMMKSIYIIKIGGKSIKVMF